MELISVDLNLLVALDVLLTEMSVSRAAERMHLGQPAMSSTLGRLRVLFDDPILVRAGRGMKATPFAEALKQPLARVLNEVDGLVNAATTFDPASSTRSFTIIASDYVALILIRPLFERLARDAPGIQIRVRPVEAGLLDDLGRGLADVVVYPRELLPTNVPFPSRPLFADHFVSAVDAAHPEVGEEITLDQFRTLPYLAANQGVLRSLADEHLDEQGTTRNVAMIAQSFVMAPFLLPGTRMYTILQRRLAEILLTEGHFTILDAPPGTGAIHEVMLWAPRHTVDPAHAWLREEIHAVAQQLDH